MKNIIIPIMLALQNPDSVSQLKQYTAALEFLKSQEDLRLKRYKAGHHILIGYGHVLKKGESYKHITKSQAELILKKDFDIAMEPVLKRYPKLSYNKQLVMAMLVFNMGDKVLKHFQPNEKSFTKLKTYTKAYKRKLKGLKKRREKEIKLFRSQDSTEFVKNVRHYSNRE